MLSDFYKEYLKYSHFKNKLDLNIDNEWRPASTATTWDALSHIRRPNVCQHRCQQPSRKPAAVSRTFTHRWLCCWRKSPCHRRSGRGRVLSHVSPDATSIFAAPSRSASIAVQTTICRPACREPRGNPFVVLRVHTLSCLRPCFWNVPPTFCHVLAIFSNVFATFLLRFRHVRPTSP